MMRGGRNIPRDSGLLFRMFLVMFLLAAVGLGFLAFLSYAGVPWPFLAVVAGLMLAFQYFMSDKLVLWSMRAKIVSPEQYPHLHNIVDRLVLQAGLPKPKLAVMQTDVPNAFATGRNPKSAVVCVTTGIMRRLEDDELEGVLAHELTHVKNRDVMVMTMASFFAFLASMLVQWIGWMMMFGGLGGRRDSRDGGGYGALAILAVWLISLLVYIVSNLLMLALSRYREYAADFGGAVLTGAPSKLASALMKISGAMARIPTEDLRRVEGANALFIVSALKGASVASLFATHPPVEKRIERLRQLERRWLGVG